MFRLHYFVNFELFYRNINEDLHFVKQEQTKQRSLLIEIVWDIVGTRPGIMYGLCKVYVSSLHVSSLFLKTEF